MLVVAAVCPCPPLLVPEVAAGAAPELDDARKAASDALGVLAAARADRLVVVGPAGAAEPGPYPAGATRSLRRSPGPGPPPPPPRSPPSTSLPPVGCPPSDARRSRSWRAPPRARDSPDGCSTKRRPTASGTSSPPGRRTPHVAHRLSRPRRALP